MEVLPAARAAPLLSPAASRRNLVRVGGCASEADRLWLSPGRPKHFVWLDQGCEGRAAQGEKCDLCRGGI